MIANSITSSIDLRLTNHNHYHIQPVSRRVCAIGSYPITSRPGSKTTKSYAGLFLPATFTNHSDAFIQYQIWIKISPSLPFATRTLTSSYTLTFINFTAKHLNGFPTDTLSATTTSVWIRLTLLTLSFYCGADETMFLIRIISAHTSCTLRFPWAFYTSLYKTFCYQSYRFNNKLYIPVGGVVFSAPWSWSSLSYAAHNRIGYLLLAAGARVELTIEESKSSVLPLHHPAIFCGILKRKNEKP